MIIIRVRDSLGYQTKLRTNFFNFNSFMIVKIKLSSKQLKKRLKCLRYKFTLNTKQKNIKSKKKSAKKSQIFANSRDVAQFAP